MTSPIINSSITYNSVCVHVRVRMCVRMCVCVCAHACIHRVPTIPGNRERPGNPIILPPGRELPGNLGCLPGIGLSARE